MNFQQLKIIREAARRDYNLTEVANMLYTSQSGVSRHIRELEEEAGLGRVVIGDAIALVFDAFASSCDIVVACVAEPAAHAPNWEYDEVRWVASRDMAEFSGQHDVAPPTMALVEWLGWT